MYRFGCIALLALASILSRIGHAQDTTRLYPVFLSPWKQQIAFIDVHGVIRIQVDTAYQLRDFDGLQMDVFHSGKCLLVKPAANYKDHQYFLMNRGGEIEAKFDPGLWPARIAGNFIVVDRGYQSAALLDLSMRQITPFKYQSTIIEFSEGLACVEKDGLMGFINEEGKEVLPFKFAKKSVDPDHPDRVAKEVYFNQFHEGMAIYTDKGKYGFIDRSQNVVIEAQFEYAHNFSDGLAYVYLPDERSGYIDKNGQWSLGPEKDKYFGDFGSGLVPVKDHKTGLKGYINKKGKYVIKPSYTEASDFVNGYAWVKEEKANNSVRKIIDPQGNVKYEGFFEFANFEDEQLILLAHESIFAGYYANSNNFSYLNYQFKTVWKPACHQRIITTPYALRECAESEVRRVSINEEKLNHVDDVKPLLAKINPVLLRLQANQKLMTIPAEIWDMTNLEELDISFNEINALPPEIGKLKNLKVLDIQFNNISKLPEELYSLTELKEINIAHNKLLMSDILQLKKRMPKTKIIFKDNY